MVDPTQRLAIVKGVTTRIRPIDQVPEVVACDSNGFLDGRRSALPLSR